MSTLDTTNTTGFNAAQHHANAAVTVEDTAGPQAATGAAHSYEDAVSGDDRTAGWYPDAPVVTGAQFDGPMGYSIITPLDTNG